MSYNSHPLQAAEICQFEFSADVVIVGGGATGLAAAIAARDLGADVIVVEANYDVGGHAILTGGHISLGGGTPAQKHHGMRDTPDLVFQDMTDWSVVQANGWPDYRYNDRGLIRAFADHSPVVFDFLVENGVVFKDTPPDNFGARSSGNSVHRENHVVWAKQEAGIENPGGFDGAGLVRPLEESARAKGVQFLLSAKMVQLETDVSGAVIGLRARYNPRIMPGATEPLQSFRSEGNLVVPEGDFGVFARKGVIVATGGTISDVNYRRMFDPRLTPVYQVAGEPWSYQDSSGERAAIEVGAALWGLGNQILEHGDGMRTKRAIGTRYNYFVWDQNSPVFPLAKATGLAVRNWADVILVNQMGDRFFDETAGNYPNGNNANEVDGYQIGDHRNAERVTPALGKYNLINAALALNEGSSAPDYSAGPVWAIFDQDAVVREGWNVKPPHVDLEGYFFKADTLEELAELIVNPYQSVPTCPKRLAQSVAQFNLAVGGEAEDPFGRTDLPHKIARGPFYAAWATPLVHDTRSGIRIAADGTVIDMNGQSITGLFAGGETAGGITLHGLGRCLVQGYIAGRSAAQVSTQSAKASKVEELA